MPKSCKQCKTDFDISEDDQSFYTRLQVPEPSLCPRCRMQRRMLHFNERALFKAVCGLCGKQVLSAHRPEVKYPVYCQPCWWSDNWDPDQYAREYDSTRPFFEQFQELRDVFPLPSLNNIYTTNVNSEYVNMCSYVKNCYLCFSADFNEDCAFSSYLEQSKRCYDVDSSVSAELCYDSTHLYKCHRVMYSVNVDESMDILFSRDLKNCSNCFGCINLRGKQYCIFNEQKTKEEYFSEIARYDLTSYDTVQELKKKTEEFFKTQPRKYMTGTNNKDVSGDYIFNSKNVHQSYDIIETEDSKYCQFFIIEGSKNCMDVTMWGSHLTQAYECCGVGNKQNNLRFCFESWNEAANLTYCSRILAPNSDLFGCIGLRNKQFCILNKQYSRDEYLALSSEIKGQMLKDGEWGEFFPSSMSTIGYNESFANKYLPLPKEEALSRGFDWNDPESRDYAIGGDVVSCSHGGECNQQCTTAFQLTPAEKDFYAQLRIPIPQLCPNCRHYERIKLNTPIILYSRKCKKCGKDIDTSHDTKSANIVYCEECYNADIA